jgi:serine/threonine protein kinase
MIVFSCPHCGKELQVADDRAGKKGKCPHCKTKTIVPAPDTRSDGLAPEQPTPKTAQDSNPGLVTLLAKLTAFLEPPRAADEIGRLGKYRVQRVIGAGGMGVVFAAEDPTLQRPVALKALRPEMSVSRTAQHRFLREARATAAVQHDNIITIYEVGYANNVPFLAMQLLHGESLDRRLKRERRLAVDEVIRIGVETADGLAAAHDHGLIHRDIKPANVFLEGPRRRVKILDFGLARVDDGDSNLTRLGVVVGTLGYLSPEQAAGRVVDARSDLFSLGCLLYHLTTGEMPFRGDDVIAMLNALATSEPMPPCCRNTAVPEDLSDLIMTLLDKDADYRPQSAHNVVEALAALGYRASP